MGNQWRAQFDAEVTFANGGGLRTDGFRLDVPHPDVTDDEVAALLVRHLGLLMVGEVRIANRTGGRGAAPRADGASMCRPRVGVGGSWSK